MNKTTTRIIDGKISITTLANATFSFGGTHHFKEGLKHESIINITWTRGDVTDDELKQLIVEALQWASFKLNTEVRINGSPYVYDCARNIISIVICY